MNKKKILELPKHDIYYINTEYVNYYINIPKYYESTNICIELKNKMGNYDMEQNDEVWIMENVQTTYSHIDNYNITLVIPILKEEQISILEKIDDSKYNQIDKILGNVINNSYNFLKTENKKVSPQIILVDNERYKTFINWFTIRYQNRIICKKMIDLIQFFNANATTYKKLETPVMNFVVGSYNTEVEAPKIEKKEKENQIVTPQEPAYQASHGFASYWVLAIITLLVSGIVAVIAFTMK